MAQAEAKRRLIVNADDFGRSESINEAVIRAHCEGILTTASLMVNGKAFEQAVELARKHPSLGVGLHLTLVCGSSALSPSEIPGLVNASGEFPDDPVAAGMRYFFNRELRAPLEAEIEAQWRKFAATSLPLDHVNGHLHFHLHPAVFKILMRRAESWGIKRMRLTREPFWLDARMARGNWLYRASHAFIFRRLAVRARAELDRKRIKHTDFVFGLLQNGRVHRGYVSRLIPCLPEGVSELYSHPSLDEFRHEFEALIDPAVRAAIHQRGIQLIRYQDL